MRRRRKKKSIIVLKLIINVNTQRVVGAYLGAELDQQLGRIRTVGRQAAHGRAEVRQARDGFAGLGGPTGSFRMAGSRQRTGGETSPARSRQAH